MHNIGVKPGDPAAEVLFALAFHCFHRKLLAVLREQGLSQSVTVQGDGILHDGSEEVEV